MKTIKVITTVYPHQLEAELNDYVGKKGYELKAVYFDSKQNAHVAVLEKEE